MSKPIKMNETLLDQIVKDFRASITASRFFDGNVEFRRKYTWDTKGKEDKVEITFSTIAFFKMMSLVHGFNTEVAWHGTAFRDEKDPKKFRIEDIIVYPQYVTGGTVNTDQVPYQSWLYSQSDEVFNNLRFQGHSHVNFGTSPSGVDLNHQEQIISQLEDDMFYIFVIWNKKMEHTAFVYDFKTNTQYENADIVIKVEGWDNFIEDARKFVTYTTTTPTTTAGTGVGATTTTTPAKTDDKTKSKPKETAGKSKPASEKPKVGRSVGDYSGYDDDDPWCGDRWRYGNGGYGSYR